MAKYIGMDAHSSTCTFCVLDNDGVEISSTVIATNGKLLKEYIRSIQGVKKLALEECELSAWLHEILEPDVEELVVCDPVKNTVYKKNKTDKLDARNLAMLLRGGFLHPVYHQDSARYHLRSFMRGYQNIVDAGVGFKNRYSSLYRKNGQKKKGVDLYSDESLLKDLPRPDQRFVAQHLYSMIQNTETERQAYVKEIKKLPRTFKEIKLLCGIHGIGEIQAAKIVAQVVEPQRFKNKYKFFAYCGLVRYAHSSAGTERRGKLAHGNKTLKCVFKMATLSAIYGDNVFRRYYESLLKKGLNEKAARNAITRKIAAISLAMLKHNAKFDESKIKMTEESITSA